LRRQVWIVDDSPTQAELARTVLSSEYEVEVFSGGPAMLEALAGAAPDLLIIDWVMPEMSGLEVCKFVRETNDSGQLPVLVLTASGDAAVLSEAFDAGANDFLPKPFSSHEISARVRALVHNRQLHTRLSQTERQLRIEAEFRERFIGMLAHDLRQPLNTFVLANGALARPDATFDQRAKHLAIQRRVAERMLRMITELLDFTRSRPETGMPVSREIIDLEPLLREVVDEMRIGHPSRRFDLDVGGICIGFWDPGRVSQIFSNLLSNAVEHSTDLAAPIVVNLHRVGENLKLSVSNQGDPIPESIVATLFRPFQRGRAAKHTTGVGLGLHIVSEIVRAHHGEIRVDCEASTTAFVVTLPIESEAEAVSSDAPLSIR
jgi:signal transduction histidine kinase